MTTKIDFEALTKTYMDAEHQLYKRLAFIHQTFRNTLNKFPVEFQPEELRWGLGHISDIQYCDKLDPVTDRTERFAQIAMTRRNYGFPKNKNNLEVVSIPLWLLNTNNVMDISQYARKAVRHKQRSIADNAASAEYARLRELDEKMTEMEQERQALRESIDVRERQEIIRVEASLAKRRELRKKNK